MIFAIENTCQWDLHLEDICLACRGYVSREEKRLYLKNFKNSLEINFGLTELIC